VDHVTAVLVVPLTTTVALNCCVPPISRDAVRGDTDTETTGGGEEFTVTVAEADLVVSATLVALTVYVPVVLGAVYSPEEEMVPPVADQVTDVLLLPVTDAANCCVAPVCIEAEVGVTLTLTAGGGCGTVTLADADFVVSATLVAVTTYDPGVLGAVYKPEEETVPPVADQVTA